MVNPGQAGHGVDSGQHLWGRQGRQLPPVDAHPLAVGVGEPGAHRHGVGLG